MLLALEFPQSVNFVCLSWCRHGSEFMAETRAERAFHLGPAGVGDPRPHARFVSEVAEFFDC